MNDSQKHMMVNKSNRLIERLTVIFILNKILMQNTHPPTHTNKQVVVIPVFPHPALLHMYEAQAMCAAAPCQPGLNGQGRQCFSVCASLFSKLKLSD